MLHASDSTVDDLGSWNLQRNHVLGRCHPLASVVQRFFILPLFPPVFHLARATCTPPEATAVGHGKGKPYPRKLFYKINEVAEILGLEAYVLRYWETRFPMLRPERTAGDERRYRARDIEILLRIKRLLHGERYTIAGAIEKMKLDPTGALEGEFRDVVAEDQAVRQGKRPRRAIPHVRIIQPDMFDPLPQENVTGIRRTLEELRRELQSLLDNLRGDQQGEQI